MRHVVLPLSGLLILTGCYTVLRHPRVVSDAVESDAVAVRSDCAACHSDWDLDRYGYAFHPGWYPVYGPWPRWYSEPWWIDVAAADRHPASAGVQVEQGAGLRNDRQAAPVAPAVPGVWMPGAGTGTALPTSSPPRGGPQAPRSQTPAPVSGGRSGAPAAEPSRPGRVSTPADPQPAQQLDTPRTGSAAQPNPSTRSANPTSDPRGTDTSGNTTPPRDASGRTATPAPTPPASAPPEVHDEPRPAQGRGMTNDRGEPKP